MNYRNVFNLFQTAVAHNLKYPRIRLNTSTGQTVVIKLAGSRSKYSGQLQLTDDRPFGENCYYGRIDQSGEFVPSRDSNPRIVALLDRLALNPAEVASEYGRLHGHCCFCEKALTDPQSIAVGYGPICADHFGLPHGTAEVLFDNRAPITPETSQDTVESLLADPSTPYWAKAVIEVAVERDAVDAANVLEVLARVFTARVKTLHASV